MDECRGEWGYVTRGTHRSGPLGDDDCSALHRGTLRKFTKAATYFVSTTSSSVKALEFACVQDPRCVTIPPLPGSSAGRLGHKTNVRPPFIQNVTYLTPTRPDSIHALKHNRQDGRTLPIWPNPAFPVSEPRTAQSNPQAPPADPLVPPLP